MCNPGREPEEAGCGVLPAGGVQVRIARIESGSMRSVDRSRTMNKPPTKQIWRAGNMLYPLPAVMVSCGRENERPNIITVAWAGTVCSDPAMLSISVRPERYSYNIIKETGEFVVNLVTKDLVFATDYCGVKSGRDVDKFADFEHYDKSGNGLPYLNKYANGYMSLKVFDTVDTGSHLMFFCDITESAVLNDVDTMTYTYYQKNVKPRPQEEVKGWVCDVCGYVYEGEDLPEDFICPLCKHGASDFSKLG
jgi:flavin reductase (DIM6/NTAB) family NADH-FMN oxidoreductase RutF